MSNSQDAFRQREQLLEDVRNGSLTPREAEKKAFALGIGDLLGGPDPHLDPLQKDRWTLVMAVVWIATRDQEALREWWNQYAEQRQRWDALVDHDGNCVGYEPRDQRKHTLTLLKVLDAEENGFHTKQKMSVKQACNDLWRKLAAGSVTADGKDNDNKRVPIKPKEWPKLKPGLSKNEDDILLLDDNDAVMSMHPHYTQVELDSSSVVRNWPPDDEKPIGYCISPEEIAVANDLFLGQVVVWIAGRENCEGPVSIQRFAKAERELFDAIYRCSEDIACGYEWPVKWQSKVPVAIDRRFFAYANTGDDAPVVNYVDEGEKREDGGVLYTADHQWCGIKLPTQWVLDRWPIPENPIAAEDARKTPQAKRKYDKVDVEKAIEEKVSAFLHRQGPRYTWRDLHEEFSGPAGRFPGISQNAVKIAFGVVRKPAGWTVGRRSKSELNARIRALPERS